LGAHDPVQCLPPKGSQLSHLQSTSTPSPKVSTCYSINSESKTFIFNLISSIILLRCKYATLGICHPGAQFLSICGLMKLENELSSPNIQLWGRHRIPVIGTPDLKKTKQQQKTTGKKRLVTTPKQCGNPVRQSNIRVSRPGNDPWGLLALPSEGSSLLQEGQQVSTVSYLGSPSPACGMWGVLGRLSSHPFPVSLVQDGNVSAGMKFQEPCGSPMCFPGIHCIGQGALPEIFPR